MELTTSYLIYWRFKGLMDDITRLLRKSMLWMNQTDVIKDWMRPHLLL